MTKAYVLVECEVDSVLSAVDDIENAEGVVSVSPVTGKYDMIVEVEVDEVDELRNIVAGDIHDTYGIKETTTCIAT
ncbi:MAG: Lrp/AsnC ligand binding domain-containing protein [Halobacteria archaeon]|nr:Lrp/AsnC ligand binding domain-containing protein [Halobacteria archaeon]